MTTVAIARVEITEAGRAALVQTNAATTWQDHPGALAVHGLNNALQMLGALAELARVDDSRIGGMEHESIARSHELLGEVAANVAALVQHCDRIERDREDLIEEAYRMAHRIVDQEQQIALLATRTEN